VFALGTRSRRRDVQARSGLLVRPSGESAYDVFGSVIDPLSRGKVDLLAAADGIGLFEGGDGSFSAFEGYEVTRSPGEDARIVSAAQTAEGRQVIVAIRTGEGLVIRTGLRTFPQRVANPNVSTLIRRVWEVFSQ
jgi:hypothetical protein